MAKTGVLASIAEVVAPFAAGLAVGGAAIIGTAAAFAPAWTPEDLKGQAKRLRKEGKKAEADFVEQERREAIARDKAKETPTPRLTRQWEREQEKTKSMMERLRAKGIKVAPHVSGFLRGK